MARNTGRPEWDLGSSPGGARPKAHVLDERGVLCIAKLPSRAADSLELARRAGVQVGSSRIEKVGGRSVLIVERFDRNHEIRIGYASALAMLESLRR